MYIVTLRLKASRGVAKASNSTTANLHRARQIKQAHPILHCYALTNLHRCFKLVFFDLRHSQASAERQASIAASWELAQIGAASTYSQTGPRSV